MTNLKGHVTNYSRAKFRLPISEYHGSIGVMPKKKNQCAYFFYVFYHRTDCLEPEKFDYRFRNRTHTYFIVNMRSIASEHQSKWVEHFRRRASAEWGLMLPCITRMNIDPGYWRIIKINLIFVSSLLKIHITIVDTLTLCNTKATAMILTVKIMRSLGPS